ncbi:MoxR-like ATPase [Frankineae bacterium MT45]|nr:MoxR-like ATPase [Frankineae bacterium MT45]
MSVAFNGFDGSEATVDVQAVSAAIAANIARVIEGKPEAIELGLIALLAEGHLLIEDIPGVGKTTFAKAIARSIDCTVRRVQFTPDLMPSDLTGVSVYNNLTSDFDFKPGPVFANVVIGDEINRASPKTQSALLECMEERQVTVDGRTFALEAPFFVVATQNPIDMEGTYPLPEAQRDRFMLRVSMGYPTHNAEIAMLSEHAASDPMVDLGPVCDADTMRRLIRAARDIFVADSLKAYAVDIAVATRQSPHVKLGASPRASLQLLRAAKARAAVRGRAHVLPDDLQAMTVPVFAHRILLSSSGAATGVTPATLLTTLLGSVPIPTHVAASGVSAHPQTSPAAHAQSAADYRVG